MTNKKKGLTVAFMAMTSNIEHNSIKKAFMASNDDNTKNSEIIEIGLPAAMLATTGRPEIIEKGCKCEKRFLDRKKVIRTKIFLFNF
jgi:hypothetical protein